MTEVYSDEHGDEAEYKKALKAVVDRLNSIDGQDDSQGAVICFVDKKAEEFSIHGVNLDSAEVKAVFMLASADLRQDLEKIKAQIEKELTNPNQH